MVRGVEMSQSEKRARRDRDKLRAFALELLENWADGTSCNGILEPLALKHGLLVEQTMKHSCGEDCTCYEAGRFPNQCLRFTALLTGDRGDPVGEVGG
jgi:hypothetical protein